MCGPSQRLQNCNTAYFYQEEVNDSTLVGNAQVRTIFFRYSHFVVGPSNEDLYQFVGFVVVQLEVKGYGGTLCRPGRQGQCPNPD